MKTIKSWSDIEALRKQALPEKVRMHITDYFKRLIDLYGDGYCPHEGYIILLEKGDPLTDVLFLEDLGIRGGETLFSIIKEFVDYDADTNLFDVLVIFSADFAMTYLIPNEEWVGQELLNQLLAFRNYMVNRCEQ